MFQAQRVSLFSFLFGLGGGRPGFKSELCLLLICNLVSQASNYFPSNGHEGLQAPWVSSYTKIPPFRILLMWDYFRHSPLTAVSPHLSIPHPLLSLSPSVCQDIDQMCFPLIFSIHRHGVCVWFACCWAWGHPGGNKEPGARNNLSGEQRD